MKLKYLLKEQQLTTLTESECKALIYQVKEIMNAFDTDVHLTEGEILDKLTKLISPSGLFSKRLSFTDNKYLNFFKQITANSFSNAGIKNNDETFKSMLAGCFFMHATDDGELLDTKELGPYRKFKTEFVSTFGKKLELFQSVITQIRSHNNYSEDEKFQNNFEKILTWVRGKVFPALKLEKIDNNDSSENVKFGMAV